jgi:Flp pilus assembly protein TadG
MAHTTRNTQLHRDERGFSLVTIGLSLTALLGATMLAIDVGMLMWARTQAQTSADAGALAGATALVYNSYSDRSASGPAVSSAINTAKLNRVVGGVVSVTPADVSFPSNSVTGLNDGVQVSVYRTSARSNRVSTLIAAFSASRRPMSRRLRRRWRTPQISTPASCRSRFPTSGSSEGAGRPLAPRTVDDTFDMYERRGQNQNQGPPLANPDIYIPPGTPDATGYSPYRDRGLRLVLKTNNQSQVAPSIYNAWAIPGGTGADYYRENIAGCNSRVVAKGDLLVPETGNMTGPTQQGAAALIATDPNAHWDDVCNCVRGSLYPVSTRIRAIPLYNPTRYTQGQHSGHSQPELEVVNYLGFFLEDVNGGGEVIGRVHPISGMIRDPNNPPIGAFAQAIILVR